MAEFTIRPYGDPVLRAVGEPVREFGAPLRSLGEAMLRAMKTAKGIGLAAPQVGLSLQLFVMDVRDEEFRPVLDGRERAPEEIMPMLLANATLTVPPGEPETYTEGCLSFPGVTGDVERVERAIVRYRDADGAPHVLECAGLLARCAQHEHDHCQGVLFIDRMTRAHQLLTAAKVKKLKRATAAEMKAARKQG
ncbi:MAG: peptide deformylase [Verrucomicrobia bacterium]|nr:peptide deformylase [Verrucomicrobiota bacterium]